MSHASPTLADPDADRVVRRAVPQEPQRPSNDALNAYPRALVESSLEKVLGSGVFRRSERHRRLMRYLVRSALDGQQDRLKEVVLAIELFDRRLDRYDPRSDPIVRVEMGRIREKLARYYDGDGRDDLFVFAIPIGSYVPRFERKLPPTTPARTVESYAVMPFSTAADDEAAAFAIGLADQLIGLMGRLRDVKVVARISAFKARERDLEVKDLGKLLQVTRVVTGSVQRQGQRYRCIAHVFDARDGSCLWSQTFDSATSGRDARGAFDLFAFQDQVADDVLGAVSDAATAVAPVSDRAAVSLARRREARDLYERASYLSRLYVAGNTDKVTDLLERAVALDAANAQAHVALATAWLHRATLLSASIEPLLPRIGHALDRAVALDPNDADAISLRAHIAFRFEFDWPRAERLFHDALRLSPHVSAVNYRFAFALILNGRFEEGLRHARVALDVDPLNLGLRAMAAQLRAFSRDYGRALEEARGVLEIDPGHMYTNLVLGMVHLYRGEFDDAVARFDFLIERHPDNPGAPLARISALGMRGDVEQGRREFDRFLVDWRDRYYPTYGAAMSCACLGDREATFAMLERAAREHDTSFCSLPIDPLFARFHDDPEFLALLARHGLRPPVR